MWNLLLTIIIIVMCLQGTVRASPPSPPTCPCDEFSQDDFMAIKKRVGDLVGFDGKKMGVLARLAFHDAGSLDPNHVLETRANGCFIDTGPFGENHGLAEIFALLNDPVINAIRLRTGLSQADLWQIAAIGAIDKAFQLTVGFDDIVKLADPKPVLNVPFRYGRVDHVPVGLNPEICPQNELGDLPGAETGFDGVKDFFVTKHNFSVEEMVAILGIHTLGTAEAGFSGYEGKWAVHDNWFDNQYFIDLLDRTWDKVTTVRDVDGTLTDFHQWDSQNDNLFMLNTDMALVYDVGDNGANCDIANGSSGTVCSTHSPGSGADAEDALEWAKLFARGPNFPNGDKTDGLRSYIPSFERAFKKMSEMGYQDHELREMCVGNANLNCAPTLSPTLFPTVTRTRSPTEFPTARPTRSPTRIPTSIPSASPSASPTRFPTSLPSVSPTKFPTTSPSDSPTRFPTKLPTKFPTISPTPLPTASPTKFPTLFPTRSPTKSPTTSPSKSPSRSPTHFPTSAPSKFPTRSPSKSPTKSPTRFPTASPSKSPTKSPTRFPTVSPTLSPSYSPTSTPSSSPSSSPSMTPTKTPTSSPSISPTSSPVSSEDMMYYSIRFLGSFEAGKHDSPGVKESIGSLLSEALELPAARLKVNNIYAGSIVVDFEVYPDSNGQPYEANTDSVLKQVRSHVEEDPTTSESLGLGQVDSVSETRVEPRMGLASNEAEIAIGTGVGAVLGVGALALLYKRHRSKRSSPLSEDSTTNDIVPANPATESTPEKEYDNWKPSHSSFSVKKKSFSATSDAGYSGSPPKGVPTTILPEQQNQQENPTENYSAPPDSTGV